MHNTFLLSCCRVTSERTATACHAMYFRLFCKSAVISDVFFNKFAREFAARPVRTDPLAHA